MIGFITVGKINIGELINYKYSQEDLMLLT